MKRHWLIAITACFSALPALSDPSLECSATSGSKVEIGTCLGEVEAAADAALDIMLEIATDAATELDRVTGRDSALPALQAAQTAWKDYMRAQCDYAGALFAGGSGTGIAIRSCRIDLTRARIKALEAGLP